MIACEVALPIRGELQEFFDRLALERAFDLVDPGNRRPDAVHLALVLAADDFGEKPLDQDRRAGLRLE